jgi:hypothetical protein
MAVEEIESVLQAKSLEYPDNLNEAVTQLLNSISSVDGDEVLIALLRSEYLHRMFWTELINDERVEASMARGCGLNESWYDTLFIQHKILSKDFWNSDVDEMGHIGGALAIGDSCYFGPEREWVRPIETFDITKVMVILAGQAYGNGSWTDEEFQTMKEILDFNGYEFTHGRFGPALVALEIDNKESLQEKWGFSTNEKSEQFVCDGFFDLSEAATRDCEAELNGDFRESLSWETLEASAKESLFFLLIAGSLADEEVTYSREESWPREVSLAKNCQHFLACIALCTATPDSIISKLEELDDELVNAALEARIS